MKKKRYISFIVTMAVCLALSAAFFIGNEIVRAANTKSGPVTVSVLSDNSERLINGYLDRYGVPTSEFTYETSGGEADDARLRNAFDRDFYTSWHTEQIEGQKVVSVTVTFKELLNIEGFVYQAERGARGYFADLKVSYTDISGDVFKELGTVTSVSTSNIVYVDFGSTIKVDAIKLEWLKAQSNVAAANEIVFLQPKSDDVEKVTGLFADYAMFELNKNVDKQYISSLRNNKNIREYASYLTVLEPLMMRAEQILDGNIAPDPRREMSTDPKADNVITRHGNIASYARSTLKMATFGTNRQPTGISASYGDVLNVYVTGDEGDPLPTLMVTQHWGSYNKWISGEYKLRLGKNTIRVPYLNQANFTTNTGEPLPAGGPVYLVNPYLPKEEGEGKDRQSTNVKVYIDGGTPFPIFRKGGDEEAFMSFLKEYSASVEDDRIINEETKSFKVVDVVEVVSDHIFVTVQATKANIVYNENGFRPQKATENWDDYVRKLLMFDGIVFNDGESDAEFKAKLDDVGAVYDPRNEWINCNIRLAQPYGAAYAGGEHVGIQVGWDEAALTGGPNYGWGYSHELGHMMDIPERLVGECSNNMVSKFNETVLEKAATRGDFAQTTAALAPDDHMASYWNTNRGNFIFWWLIESYYPGYWARLENLYRYFDIYGNFSVEEKKLGTMNATEKQVYLSSLVTHIDMSYYFERWGYNLSVSDYVFKADGPNTSEAFKLAMKKAKEKGDIDKNGQKPKLWYLDAAEWHNRYPDIEGSKLYDKTTVKPEIKSIVKSANGYNLIINSSGYDSKAHLGFEILQKFGSEWKVVGFTYERMFLDSTEYAENYAPTYKVIAYDRALQTSNESDEKTFVPSKSEDRACKIGSTYYGSLHEAVAAARSGDTIVVLKSLYETGIVIDKELTVTTESENNVIYKSGPEPIFTIVNDEGKKGKLTLKGTASARLTFDGYGIESSGSLIYSKNGELTMEHCVLKNNLVKWSNTSSGGALKIEGGGTFNYCEFSGNSARLGGAVYIENRGGTSAVFNNCTFKDNKAYEGAGVYNTCTARFTSCNFQSNSAESVGGAIANLSGGVIEIAASTFTGNSARLGGAMYLDGKTTVRGGEIKNNTATEDGGAIFFRTTVKVRALTVEKSGDTLTEITNNTCVSGSCTYLGGEVLGFEANVRYNNSKYAFCVAGSVKVTGGKFKGDLFKAENAELTLEKLPELEGNMYIYTDAVDPNCPVLVASQDIGDEFLSKLQVREGQVVRSDNKREVRVKMNTHMVAFKYGDKVEQRHVLPGQTIVLEAFGGDTSQKTYVSKWKSGGVTYNIGDSVVVNGDMTFVGEIADKYKIEFKINEEAGAKFGSIVYAMPREKYSLPKIEVDGYVLNGWDFNGKLYQPYLTLSATQNRTYVAKLALKFEVQFYVRKLGSVGNGDMLMFASRHYGYGSKINYEVYEDDEYEYIPYNGFVQGYQILYADGTLSDELIDFSTYTVTSDLKLVAKVIENSSIVIYSVFEKSPTGGNDKFYDENNPTVTEYAEMGSKYKVELQAVPAGYHIASMNLDGVEYGKDELDGLEFELDMPYYLVNIYIEKNIYNVKYSYNNTYFKTETKRYGDKLVFEDPTDTLLKEAFKKRPEITNYHFTNYELITSASLIDGGSASAINIRLNDEMVISDDIEINIVVYIEGQEVAPPKIDDGDNVVSEWRTEYSQQAKSAASALISEISAQSFALTQSQQEDYVDRINVELDAVIAEIDKRVTENEMSGLVSDFTDKLGKIRAEATLWAQKNAAVGKIERIRDDGLKAFEGNSSENIQNVKAQIVSLAESAISSINSAVSSESFERTVADVESKITALIADNDPIFKQKNQAISAMQTMASTLRSNVNALKYLTSERKNGIISQADNELGKAVEKVNAVIVESGSEGEVRKAEQIISGVQSDYQAKVNELSLAATNENKIKSDAIDALGSAAKKSTDKADTVLSEGKAEVELDGLIRNNIETNGRIEEIVTPRKAEIAALLSSASSKIAATTENASLSSTVFGIASEVSAQMESIASSASEEVRSLILAAEKAAREDAVDYEATPLVTEAQKYIEALSLTDKTDFFEMVLDAKNKAEISILAAERRGQIDDALSALRSELDEAKSEAVLESVKQAAKQQVSSSVEAGKGEIDRLVYLDETSKSGFKSRVDEAKDAAIEAIEDASDVSGAKNAVSLFEVSLAKIKDEACGADNEAMQQLSLAEVKQKASRDIASSLPQTKDGINSFGFLTQDEKDAFCSECEQKADETTRAIEQADTANDVTSLTEEYRSFIKDKESLALARNAESEGKAKKSAADEIIGKSSEGVAALNALAFLDETSRNGFKTRMENAKEEALGKVENALDTDDIRNCISDFEAALRAIADEAEAANDEAVMESELDDIKQITIANADTLSDELKDVIIKCEFLSPEEKEAFSAEINEANIDVQSQIRDADDKTEIKDIYSAFARNLEKSKSEVLSSDASGRSNTIEQVVAQIEAEVSKAKQAVDDAGFVSDDDKSGFKATLDGAKVNADEKLASAYTMSDINAVKGEVNEVLDEVSYRLTEINSQNEAEAKSVAEDSIVSLFFAFYDENSDFLTQDEKDEFADKFEKAKNDARLAVDNAGSFDAVRNALQDFSDITDDIVKQVEDKNEENRVAAVAEALAKADKTYSETMAYLNELNTKEELLSKLSAALSSVKDEINKAKKASDIQNSLSAYETSVSEIKSEADANASKSKTVLIVVIVVCCVCLAAAVTTITIVLVRRKKSKKI